MVLSPAARQSNSITRLIDQRCRAQRTCDDERRHCALDAHGLVDEQLCGEMQQGGEEGQQRGACV